MDPNNIGDIDLGDGDVPEPNNLARKYEARQLDIVTQKIELPIKSLPEMFKDDDIRLDPSFQRRDRWNQEKQSRFIESIIMNVPIPPIFLGEDDYGKYVVLDGRQRLTALSQFLKNEFELKKLEVWSELNGLRYQDLEKRDLTKYILRRFMPAIILLKESSPGVKFDVFDRLNTGSVLALPMEIRNAIYQGPFNTNLHELTKLPTFRALWNIPLDDTAAESHKLYSTMADLELALRFFALRNPSAMDVRFKDYLGDYMDTRNKAYIEDPSLKANDKALFEKTVQNCMVVFGDDAFCKIQGDGTVGQKSAPLADAIMVAMSDVDLSESDSGRISAIKDALIYLMKSDETFIKAVSSGTNGKGAIESRIERARAVIQNI